MTLDTTTVDHSPVADGGRASRSRFSVGALGRSLRTSAPILPFLAYVILGLGIPTIVIINYAFRSNSGALTMHNITTILTQPQYRSGFETSLKLALVTAIIPAIIGTLLAYAIATSEHDLFKRLIAAASGVLANFGGVNLAFMFIASFGYNALVTHWLNAIGLNPWNHGFSIYKFWGVALVYMYFQVPLMVLIITPALHGLRESWREAAQNLGASSWTYWRFVGIPVLMPSVLGSTFFLFGSGFAAYATAEALTNGSIALTPIQIGAILQGNVLSGEENIAYALGFAMIVILLVTIIGYTFLRRRASRWLR